MRNIIENAEADAYLVRKRELRKTGHRYFDSYQRRLYKTDKVEYKGIVFTDPIVNGKEMKLDSHYFLNHHYEYYENLSKSNDRYFVICAYEWRQSYDDLLDFLKDSSMRHGFMDLDLKSKEYRFRK